MDEIAVGADRITGAGGLFPSLSRRSWERYDATGRAPRGFKLGGRKLWRVADLERWAAAGFPSREEFERQQREGKKVALSAEKPAETGMGF